MLRRPVYAGYVKDKKGNFIHEYKKTKKSGGYAVYDYYFAKHKKGCSRKSIKRHFLSANHIDNIFSTLFYLTVSDYAEAGERRKILLGIIKNCFIEDLKITVQFISGRKYEIQVPEKLRFKVSDVYKIKVVDGVENRVNDFVFHAAKNILKYGPGRNDYRIVMKWIKNTEKAIKVGEGIKPLF